jgi:hypothetical protein
MVLKTPERARRAGVPFGDALGFVELVRDAVRGGGTRVDRLGGARRSLEHALLPIDVRALGAELLLRDERVCVNNPRVSFRRTSSLIAMACGRAIVAAWRGGRGVQ